MTYTVTWKPAAEEELASLWLDATDRNSITATADEIDHLLRTNPLEQGESRSGSLRITFVAALGVVYHVEEDDRVV